jgi:hypothetical protein
MPEWEQFFNVISSHLNDIRYKRSFAADEITYTVDTNTLGCYTIRGGKLTAQIPLSFDHVVMRLHGIEKVIQF